MTKKESLKHFKFTKCKNLFLIFKKHFGYQRPKRRLVLEFFLDLKEIILFLLPLSLSLPYKIGTKIPTGGKAGI